MSLRCVIIGAGNLAFHLGEELQRKGFGIVQVYSRTETSAQELAGKLDSAYTTSIEKIITNADIFFIALKDSAFEEVLSGINFQNKLLIHSSGSQPMNILKPFTANYGVLYPLQTFSKQRPVDFSKIPVFVEANTELNFEKINRIARELSSNVKAANSEERINLHIAAVFANNFVNHLYTLANSVLDKNGFSFEILKPLIIETAEKIGKLSPYEAQTGPAVRFDQAIIEKHIEALSDSQDLVNLYKTISKSIFELHQKMK